MAALLAGLGTAASTVAGGLLPSLGITAGGGLGSMLGQFLGHEIMGGGGGEQPQTPLQMQAPAPSQPVPQVAQSAQGQAPAAGTPDYYTKDFGQALGQPAQNPFLQFYGLK